MSVERDKTLTHAVEVVSCDLEGDCERQDNVAEAIEEAMLRINERAMAAEMVVLSTAIMGSGYASAEFKHFVTYIVSCQWVERSKLEAMQRQQRIMGGNNGGPR